MNKRTFRQYLKEDTSTHYPWQVTSNEELLKLPGWVKYDEERYDEPGGDVVVFHDTNTGEVYFSGRIDENEYFEMDDNWAFIVDAMLVEHGGKWYIPFRIKEWKNSQRSDDLALNDVKISSFIGFPDTIKGSLTVTNCPNLTLEECPSIIGHSVAWWQMPITNRIDKVFKEIGGTIIVPPAYRGFLSFLKINKLKSLYLPIANEYSKLYKQEAFEAKEVVNDHLIGDRDTITCQRELIEKDLDEYAEF